MRVSSVMVLVAGLLLLVPALPAEGQERGIMLDLGVGAAVPVGAFDGPPSSPGAGTGLLLAGDVHYRLSPRLSVGVGFSRDRFSCSAPGCGSEGAADHIVVMGPSAGATLHFSQLEEAQPWVRLALGYQRPSYGGNVGPDLDWGFAYQLGAGLDLRISDRFSALPRVRWASVGSPVTFGKLVTRTEDPRYVMAEMGLRVQLGN